MTKRKQLERQSVNEIGEGDIAMMLHFFNDCCPYCNVKLQRNSGSDNSLELDHYISLSSQSNQFDDTYTVFEGLTLQNTLACCRKCNRAKSNKNPQKWINDTFQDASGIIYNIEIYFSQQLETHYA